MNEGNLNLVKDSLLHRRLTATPEASTIPTQKEIEELFVERITPETELPPMQPLFRMFDVPCFYRGELVADCGKAKSGKTTFLSILMAACLTQKVLALERITTDTRAETAADSAEYRPLRVLWIDTEQSQQSTQEIIRDRIIPLSGRDPQSSDLNETFFAFNLRGLGYEKRSKMVDVAIRTIEPDICIIDGIKDLMTDINDAVQATSIMERLMGLAKEQNCCIVCVLHQNKSEQDRNMRGSIGTELTNKAFEVFQCEKVSDSDTFKVTQTYSRKKRIRQKFYYGIDAQGLPVEQSDYQEQPRDDLGRWTCTKAEPASSSEPLDEKDLRRLFSKAMEGRHQRPFGEVMAIALKKCGVIDAKAYYSCLDQAIEKRIVCKVVHPDSGATWVELLESEMIF